MKRHHVATKLLEETFGFDRTKPDAKHRLESYPQRKLTFEEWEVKDPHGHRILIVYWPQHPRRTPLNVFDRLQDACREFAQCHVGRIRP